jgi:hypothetical protein
VGEPLPLNQLRGMTATPLASYRRTLTVHFLATDPLAAAGVVIATALTDARCLHGLVGGERTTIGCRDNPRLSAPLSAAERDHFSSVGKCPHPLLGHGPLKLGVGGFVGRKKLVPNDGRVGGVDQLQRPPHFALKPDKLRRPRLHHHASPSAIKANRRSLGLARSLSPPSALDPRRLSATFPRHVQAASLRLYAGPPRDWNMRPKRPTHVLLDQVRITRDGESATIDHADPKLSGAHITIGPGIATMTDADIVEMYNDILDSQWALLEEWDKTVIEEPAGEPQIDFHENSDQWSPRGDVLRCIIDDGGPDGEATIHIDDQELSLREFGRLLAVHAGWGMRIVFVPEEFVTESPKVKIRKSSGRKR